MEKLFIPVEYKLDLDKSKLKNTLKKLPNDLILVYASQYKKIAQEIKEIIKHKNIISSQQILGCTRLKFNKKAKTILFIGSGVFHAISISSSTNLPVYIFYPEEYLLKKITKEQEQELQKKQKSSYVNYLNSKKIGILVSTKPGQNKLEHAFSLKNKIQNKDTYLFLGNNINSREFENFDIQSWVNTACPRLDLDNNKIINSFNLNFS